MSASNEWTEWHLTPRGWERGSEKIDFSGPTDVAPPPDRVLTSTYHEYLSSVYSSIDRYHKETWRGNDEALIKKLLAQFGEPPKEL